jgi:quinohemoprotein ethanol dehydrogenase
MGVGSWLLSTASGLIFHSESDGRIVAYDIKNGSELWSFQTGAGADAPVITYETGGSAASDMKPARAANGAS